MPTDSAVRFARLLHAYELLTPQQLEVLDGHLLDRFPRTGPLACELVRRGWLTAYQANKLVRGKAPELVRGPFLVLDRLGRGGMGKVYKVRHRILGRLAALKVLYPALLADAHAARRFRREIRLSARMHDRHIVRAYDMLRLGEGYGLAMEYVDGEDLQALVRREGPLPVERACDYVRQAALGLQHAWERGVVHRDIKPSNLLRTREGVIKVADFGLARLGAENEVLTRRDAGLGTADYVAPEQAVDSHAADVRADLYSLGCTFYFLLTGQPPFPDGTPLVKLKLHSLEEPRAVQELRPEVPAAVSTVLRKLLAKRPEERYQTPQELVTALVGWQRGLETVVEFPPAETKDDLGADRVLAPPPDRLPTGVQQRAERAWLRVLGEALGVCVRTLRAVLRRSSKLTNVQEDSSRAGHAP